jgi:peroxiredoxin
VRGAILLFVLAACSPAPASAPAPVQQSPVEVIGSSPPEWTASEWFNSPPLSLASLRDKVVVVRWFMSPDCPLCSGSAPALRALHERHAGRGLVVIGMYHHKEAAPLDAEDVRGWAAHYGYTFPVAIDRDWRTLKRWWLDGHDRAFTSVTFVLDRQGVIRALHPGGLLDPHSQEFADLEARIVALLAL